MAQAHGHPPTGNWQYFTTWLWLLVMTALALGVGYVNMGHNYKAFLLVSITLAKIVLIARIFMHLKFEKMNLVMLTFSPLVLAAIMYCFQYGEVRGSETHWIEVRPGVVLTGK